MKTNDAIFIKVQKTTIAIRTETILYMEKTSRKITIHIVGGEDVYFYGKYDSVMPLLDERFVHPHESYVINMQHIYRLGMREAVMIDGQKISMGDKCFGRLKRAYDAYIRHNIWSRLET